LTDEEKSFDFIDLSNLEEIYSDTYNEDNYAAKISLAKTKRGDEGIKIRTKRTNIPKEHGPGIWIPKSIDLRKWFLWFKENFYKIVNSIWRKGIDLKVELEKREEEIEQLKKELELTRKELEKKQQERDRLELELKLAREVIDKVDDYKRSLDSFIEMVETSVKEDRNIEHEIKSFLKENKWILGLDCEVRASEKSIDPSYRIDMHIETDIGQHKIFEFKSPNKKIFRRNLTSITEEVSRGLHQLIMYLRHADVYSYWRSSSLYGVQAPLGVLLIGYNLTEPEKTMLEEWNRHLRPHIRIITYDSVISSAKRTLSHITQIKKQIE